MARFSEAFGLRKSQAELDFVDIDVKGDIPLFLDPYAFVSENDVWSQHCNHLIVTFFQAVLDCVRANDQHRAMSLLAGLKEPAENHLGVSEGGNDGRGIGPKQARQIFDALRTSPAAKTGLLQDLSDFALFIPHIGRDKISDITTNVVRGELVKYTGGQCRLHDIPLQKMPSGLMWNPDRQQWDQSYVPLPVFEEKKLILTPKFVVRYRVGVDPQRYRQHFVLNFLQEQHLKAGDGLVTAIKNKQGHVRKVVHKKDLDAKYPDDKGFLSEFSIEHPEVINRYRDSLKNETKRVPNINPQNFSEADLARYLIAELDKIPAGRDHADAYHSLMIGVVSFLYYPHLIYPDKEFSINQGRKRIDIIYTNAKDVGLFYRIAMDQSLKATIIHVECKNYSTEIANEEFDQLIGRFDKTRGKVGILLFRKAEKNDLVLQRCRDAVAAGQGLVLPMDDAFLTEALHLVADGKRRDIDRQIDDLFRSVVN